MVFLLEKCQTCYLLVVARSEVDFCLGREGAVLLACPDGRHWFTLVDIAWQQLHVQLAVFYLIAICKVAEEHPALVQILQTNAVVGCIEVIHIAEVAREFVLLGWLQTSLFAYRRNRGVLGENLWPSVFPCYRQEIGVATCVVHIFLIRAASQEHCPPVALAIFYDVGMAGT